MWRRGKTSRRIKRGENYKEGPYWSLFLAGSLCAHAFFIIAYGPLLSFITGFQRHEPVLPTFVYVTIGTLKEKLVPAPSRAYEPVEKAAYGNRAGHVADAQPETPTNEKEGALPTDEMDTSVPSSGETHVADAGLIKGPGKDEGITFIRGDTLTVEKFGEKINIAGTKDNNHTLARVETADSERFRSYSTVKDIVIGNVTTRSMAEPAESIAQRPFIGLKTSPNPSSGIGQVASAPIGKDAATPGKFSPAVMAARSRQNDRIAAKAPFTYGSGGASAISNPVFSDMPQKKPDLPGRVFAAEINQAEPAKARAISEGGGNAARLSPPAIRLTSPAAGPSDKKIVTAKGKVSGYGIVSVVLAVGGRQKELLVKGGEFESEISLDEGRNLIRVETVDASGESASDMVEVVYSAPVEPSTAKIDLVVRIEYKGEGGSLSTSHKWMPHPITKTSGQAAAPEFKVDAGTKGGTVSVPRALPGIYTIGVGYDTTASGPVEAVFEVTVFGYDPVRGKNRKIGPVRLEGKGHVPAVRLLLPEGVFWEDDSWFSGVMESGRTTTKYKMPEGVVWKEQD